jgi:hypothetical protein
MCEWRGRMDAQERPIRHPLSAIRFFHISDSGNSFAFPSFVRCTCVDVSLA